ncbi:Gfo/Idh/MocA family protein [Ketogulonicigenium vulgare]|uniref:Oxidoreductase domain protein n=1 Tax=Ketogulonicigenium vulgare (strain WSH-001) TaxID=759362 RepID=F9Y7P2_KETVW|nr:Gfo/Idh/MocA family oxidoreductase [Ketogulonicigenium vulgare]ADO41617.1 oxidoreductase domain protein [Ketogulonicigenium vulgare Y25]AEM39858.1 Oxidoreductase domain protein [Ketogulonicigenium vulgare WSH-001]ALJ80073.1 oxidoreductase [Ketogulonicigenium vulgare]ANW32950.1 oxidoreductase [Ketogulonicigenium vulgare]AOZ53548.1 oxidoreductase domain protein [Ketogulonicigenium vulgare]
MSDFKRPLRLGMVGGGAGAFIGYVHRVAARLDGQYELVAGALSSRPEVARESGLALGLAEDRIYTDFKQMAEAEAARPDGIEVVAIVTPNHMHTGPARAFLEAGIHVICDKPLAATLEDAEALASVTPKGSARFLLTHTYTGYPLVRLAREMVARGDLGKIRMVQAEYAQDWLTEATEAEQNGTAWRADPAKSGAGGAIADIGTHAYNLTRFVSGLQVTSLSADLDAFVPGRRVDDNANIMLRFEGGAKGMLWASQVAVGHENSVRLRIYGDKGSLDWQQENPNQLHFSQFGAPTQIITRNGAGSNGIGRVPSGHPEGYLEAFATLYQDFAGVLRSEEPAATLPTLADGIEGLRFIMAAIRSSEADGRWQPINQ